MSALALVGCRGCYTSSILLPNASAMRKITTDKLPMVTIQLTLTLS